jgi:hypothetical protein
MIKLIDVVDAWVQPREHQGPEPFTWTTPIRHDPFLVGQLQRANLELRALFSIAAQASVDSAFEAAADALANCVHKLREVQRLEALRLYPVLSHQASGSSNAAATVAYLRLRAHTLARRFLRLSEELIAAARARRLADVAAYTEARSALDSYIEAKELQLYEAYALTASVPSAAAG